MSPIPIGEFNGYFYVATQATCRKRAIAFPD